MSIRRILHASESVPCQPWPRRVLAPADWAAMAAALPDDGELTLLALWADTVQVHALLLDQAGLAAIPVSCAVEDGVYPALSPHLPHAALFERTIRDLWGRSALGGTDVRPWLDHGAWPLASPLSVRPDPPRPPYDPPDQPIGDTVIMQLPLGPIWGRIEEAAQLRLTLDANGIAAAESRLGFTHKGTLALARGKPARTAARFAARLSGDATVAHAIAFATAVEAALSVVAPPRAVALRRVMLELERTAGHLGNLSEIGRLADAPTVRTLCGALRERLVRACAIAFGHRLMMDCVVPGGVALDIAQGGREAIPRLLGEIAGHLGPLARLHDGYALATRLSGVGRVDQDQAAALGAGGVAARASGRRFDARALDSDFAFADARRSGGDASARQHLRISEIGQSLELIGAALDALPAGPLTVTLPQSSGEGIGYAESVRGDVWHWIRLDHGQIAGWFPRDPGWALWPLAEQILPNAAFGDVALIRTSLDLPASGMDL
jgi:Ni,Fe-hydrogenase III large subunit